MARPNQITLCSFCGKSHAEVRKLIAGPGVYICDSCILVCKNVLDKELQDEEKKKAIKLKVPGPSRSRPSWTGTALVRTTRKRRWLSQCITTTSESNPASQ